MLVGGGGSKGAVVLAGNTTLQTTQLAALTPPFVSLFMPFVWAAFSLLSALSLALLAGKIPPFRSLFPPFSCNCLRLHSPRHRLGHEKV